MFFPRVKSVDWHTKRYESNADDLENPNTGSAPRPGYRMQQIRKNAARPGAVSSRSGRIGEWRDVDNQWTGRNAGSSDRYKRRYDHELHFIDQPRSAEQRYVRVDSRGVADVESNLPRQDVRIADNRHSAEHTPNAPHPHPRHGQCRPACRDRHSREPDVFNAEGDTFGNGGHSVVIDIRHRR